jgi:hypothetical protein
LECLAKALRLEQEIKGIQIGKEEVKQSLFTDDMILFLKDPKNSNSTKKLLEIKNSFGKVAGYKFNIQKSVGFLHTNSEQIEKEIRETIPFTIASKTIVYIEINVVKETNTFYLFIYLFTYLLSNIF